MEKKAIAVDLTTPKDSAQVLPQAPILSSQQTEWEGIFFAYYRHPSHETLEHYLMQHTLIVTNGNSQFQVEQRIDNQFKRYQNGNGRFDIFPANLSHWAYWDREIEFSAIAICPKFLQRLVIKEHKIKEIELIPQLGIIDPIIAHITLALKAEIETGCLTGRLYGESLGTALAMRLIQNYSVFKPQISYKSKGLPKSQLRQVIDYINAHLSRDISLSELAEVAFMSESHFTRLFKQSMGITPYQYLLEQRIERAKQLLKQNKIAIADVALQCGFANQTHLTKRFRQFTGVTPKVYRNEY